ncbi:hypothetical protein H2199_002661 [Coniosporium tulheliwenetii]|uniref:Uncharacterized protein n=1 Tax=Coniosporium tulheliwenetii TaxID=3383036 RepID=A0ACC2ZGS1_9PEZI|nr:hypothetical protein H2199_002661 [Cladosporium sp. JES 115]
MAYNKGYNPDALPAHAEPEQAAQLLSQSQQAARPPRTSSRPDTYTSKPAAPLPPPSARATTTAMPVPMPHTAVPAERDRYADRPAPLSYMNDARRRESTSPATPATAAPSARRLWPRSPASLLPRPPAPISIVPTSTDARAPARQQRPRRAVAPLQRRRQRRQRAAHRRRARPRARKRRLVPFDAHTVRMMIRMFDTDRSGTINFDEFCGLWAFLAAWRTLFDRFDLDRSGNISLPEFSEALVAFGYRLSGQFGRGAIGFDLFVQACISLKRMTDVFKRYDEDRDGEEFLTGAQQLFLFNSISAVTDTGLY